MPIGSIVTGTREEINRDFVALMADSKKREAYRKELAEAEKSYNAAAELARSTTADMKRQEERVKRQERSAQNAKDKANEAKAELAQEREKFQAEKQASEEALAAREGAVSSREGDIAEREKALNRKSGQVAGRESALAKDRAAFESERDRGREVLSRLKSAITAAGKL